MKVMTMRLDEKKLIKKSLESERGLLVSWLWNVREEKSRMRTLASVLVGKKLGRHHFYFYKKKAKQMENQQLLGSLSEK